MLLMWEEEVGLEKDGEDMSGLRQQSEKWGSEVRASRVQQANEH